MSVRVVGASKTYRSRGGARVAAIDDVTLEAREGELLAVVGPSGSGKSTLLRVVAGLESLDAGVVEVGGVDVTRVPAGRRGVAMVFQDAALFPHLDVAGNIGLGERARGRGRAATRALVTEVAEGLGIDRLLERMPSELSGGERQRVALARAVIRSPAVCLLDEPLSSLDADLRLRMRAEVKALQRRTGSTMVHVTHDQLEAMAIGDRIAVIDAGRIVQVGTPEAVHDAPATTFVARFVGQLPMNLLPRDGVTVGIRPERIRLQDNGTSSDGTHTGGQHRGAAHDVQGRQGGQCSSVQGLVELVEPAGEDRVVRVVHDDGTLLVRVGSTQRPAVGDRVTVTWDRADEHRFDRDTGSRL